MLQEISKHSLTLSKFEDVDLTWHNHVLTIRCDSGLYLLDYSYNIRCLDENVDFLESKIMTSKSSPAFDLFPSDLMKSRMTNTQLTQLMTDPALWPHSMQLMNLVVIAAFDWSPVDFIHNNESVIAVLNSMGNVDLYAPHRHKWHLLENLSIKLKLAMMLNSLVPPVAVHGPLDVEQIKHAAYALETNAICWSTVLNVDKSCFFVTAQKNNHILFWLLKCDNNSIDVKLEYHISDNCVEIIAMKWIPTSDTHFLLLCSNIQGQMIAYEFQVEDSCLRHLNTQPLWVHKDKMVAQYIQYELLQDNIVIAYNKHRYLVMQIVDKSGKVLSENITYVNDQKITAVVKGKNSFYVSTMDRALYLVQYTITDNTLNVDVIPVAIKSIPSAFELYSFAFSTNDAIVALALLDRTILCRKRPIKLDLIFYTQGNNDVELSTMINNPTKELSHLWDVIEVFRCKTLKLKRLPTFDYKKLYDDAKTDIYFARVFLVILNLHKSLNHRLQNSSRDLVPETTLDEVKSIIMSLNAIEVMQKLYKTSSREIVENKFEYECFVMAGTYLEEFCQKHNKKLNEFLSSEIVNIFQKMKSFLKYTCQCCDESLEGFVCKNDHLNMFCALTFTLIETNDYFVCRGCDVTVRSDLFLDKPKCVFCDLYLSNCDLPI